MWDQNTQQFLGPQQMAEREKMMAVDRRHAPSPVVRNVSTALNYVLKIYHLTKYQE